VLLSNRWTNERAYAPQGWLFPAFDTTYPGLAFAPRQGSVIYLVWRFNDARTPIAVFTLPHAAFAYAFQRLGEQERALGAAATGAVFEDVAIDQIIVEDKEVRSPDKRMAMIFGYLPSFTRERDAQGRVIEEQSRPLLTATKEEKKKVFMGEGWSTYVTSWRWLEFVSSGIVGMHREKNTKARDAIKKGKPPEHLQLEHLRGLPPAVLPFPSKEGRSSNATPQNNTEAWLEAILKSATSRTVKVIGQPDKIIPPSRGERFIIPASLRRSAIITRESQPAGTRGDIFLGYLGKVMESMARGLVVGKREVPVFPPRIIGRDDWLVYPPNPQADAAAVQEGEQAPLPEPDLAPPSGRARAPGHKECQALALSQQFAQVHHVRPYQLATVRISLAAHTFQDVALISDVAESRAMSWLMSSHMPQAPRSRIRIVMQIFTALISGREIAPQTDTPLVAVLRVNLNLLEAALREVYQGAGRVHSSIRCGVEQTQEAMLRLRKTVQDMGEDVAVDGIRHELRDLVNSSAAGLAYLAARGLGLSRHHTMLTAAVHFPTPAQVLGDTSLQSVHARRFDDRADAEEARGQRAAPEATFPFASPFQLHRTQRKEPASYFALSYNEDATLADGMARSRDDYHVLYGNERCLVQPLSADEVSIASVARPLLSPEERRRRATRHSEAALRHDMVRNALARGRTLARYIEPTHGYGETTLTPRVVLHAQVRHTLPLFRAGLGANVTSETDVADTQRETLLFPHRRLAVPEGDYWAAIGRQFGRVQILDEVRAAVGAPSARTTEAAGRDLRAEAVAAPPAPRHVPKPSSPLKRKRQEEAEPVVVLRPPAPAPPPPTKIRGLALSDPEEEEEEEEASLFEGMGIDMGDFGQPVERAAQEAAEQMPPAPKRARLEQPPPPPSAPEPHVAGEPEEEEELLNLSLEEAEGEEEEAAPIRRGRSLSEPSGEEEEAIPRAPVPFVTEEELERRMLQVRDEAIEPGGAEGAFWANIFGVNLSQSAKRSGKQ
jgi:hypothetical protein